MAVMAAGLLLAPLPVFAESDAGEGGSEAASGGGYAHDDDYYSSDDFSYSSLYSSSSEAGAGEEAAAGDAAEGAADAASSVAGSEAAGSGPPAVGAGAEAEAEASKGPGGLERAGEVALDVAILRPFGAVATVAGLGFFAVSAPFLAATGDLDLVGEFPFVKSTDGLALAQDVFVVERAKYAFDRPLGQF